MNCVSLNWPKIPNSSKPNLGKDPSAKTGIWAQWWMKAKTCIYLYQSCITKDWNFLLGQCANCNYWQCDKKTKLNLFCLSSITCSLLLTPRCRGMILQGWSHCFFGVKPPGLFDGALSPPLQRPRCSSEQSVWIRQDRSHWRRAGAQSSLRLYSVTNTKFRGPKA